MNNTLQDIPAWQHWMTGLLGGASRQTSAAARATDRFYCLLDDLPLHLLPRHWRDVHDPGDSRLSLNPDCTICEAGDVPLELRSQPDMLSGFDLQGTTAWVRHPATDAWLPFWLGTRLESTIRDLQAGKDASELSFAARSVLIESGILTSRDRRYEALQRWDALVKRAGPMFRERGYAPVSDLLHRFHTAALRRYYRMAIRSGSFRLGDGQSSRRYVSYNDPVARFFHRQMASAFSAIAGEPVKPSYVYAASYLSGAELKKHTDRKQCEFSLTMCLDFTPEPERATPWPIRLETLAGDVAIYQLIGDALAYRGTRVPHYRTVLGPGQTSTSIFFHYVGDDFDGPLG